MKEIALIGVAQSLFFIFLIVLKREKKLKDYLLIGFLLCLGAELLYRYLLYSENINANSRLILFDIVYWALFGPVLLLYVQSVINKNFRIMSLHLVHLATLVISLLSVLPYFLSRNSFTSFVEFYNSSKGIIKAGLFIWEFSSAGYLLVVLIILFKHKQKIKHFFSNVEKKELIWLLYLTLGFSFYVYLSYVDWILNDVFNIKTGLSFISMLSTILTIYVFILGLFAYKQEGIFFESDLQAISNPGKEYQSIKYKSTGLTKEELETLNSRMVEFMQKEKPYLESEITINDLAKQLETTVHKLSQVINEVHRRNFFDFINFYRIGEVKKLLNDSTHEDLKIESIAYDCGFSSKSSFYAIFKKHTHLTPTEFRKRVGLNGPESLIKNN